MNERTVRPFQERGHYTEVHNLAFDYIMPRVSTKAWKVLCFVLRKTKGWDKPSDALSYSQIKKGTGIKSDTTVRAAIIELTKGKYIKAMATPEQWEASRYALNKSFEISTSEIEAASKNGVEEIESPAPKNEATTTPKNEVVPTPKNEETERTYESHTKNSTPNGVAANAAAPLNPPPSSKQKTSKPDAIPNTHPVRLAIAQACGIDTDSPLTEQKTFVLLANTTRSFLAASLTAEDVARAESYWYANDGRGRRGELPSLSTLRDSAMKMNQPPRAQTQTLGASNGTHQQYEPAAVRRERNSIETLSSIAEREREVEALERAAGITFRPSDHTRYLRRS